MFKGKNVVITGGCGFIGSHLARRMVELGSNVTVVDSLIPEYGGNLYNLKGIEKHVHFNFSDVRDKHSLSFLLKGQDYLFNLAGQTSHLDSMHDPFTDLDINSKSQLSILEVCKEINPKIKIVFASTRQLYGKPNYLPVDEKHPTAPTDVNGINKLAGEMYHLLYNNVYGIRTSVLRLTNTYGPGMRIKDARQTFVGVWIKNILQETPFEVWGGEQLRDFNYVSDVVDAFVAVSLSEKSWGKIFNLGSLEVISLSKLAKMIIEINGRGDYVVRSFPEERKKIDIGDYYSDYSLIKNELGWQPQVSLKIGIEKTLNYFRDNIEFYVDSNVLKPTFNLQQNKKLAVVNE